MGFHRYQSASGLGNMVSSWPSREGIVKLCIFFGVLDIIRHPSAWLGIQGGGGEIMNPQKFSIKIYGGMCFPGK